MECIYIVSQTKNMLGNMLEKKKNLQGIFPKIQGKIGKIGKIPIIFLAFFEKVSLQKNDICCCYI